MRGNNNNGAPEVYSSVVKAGKRTYFFDVKQTRSSDLFISITESRRSVDDSGEAVYEKQKVFVYLEDLRKFTDGLCDAIDFVEDMEAKNSGKGLVLVKKNSPCDSINRHREMVEEREAETEEFDDFLFENQPMR